MYQQSFSSTSFAHIPAQLHRSGRGSFFIRWMHRAQKENFCSAFISFFLFVTGLRPSGLQLIVMG